MDSDPKSLGEMLRKERASPSLQPVSENFYSELKEIVRDAEERYPPFSREIENLRNLAGDIYSSREKKLVLLAVSYARSDEDASDVVNATPAEKEFFENLVAMLKNRRSDFQSQGEAKEKQHRKKTKKSSPTKEADSKKPVVKTGGSGIITLRILEDLPPIVGSDKKTYGPFKTEDVVALPEKNAKVFLKHKYGELIEIRT